MRSANCESTEEDVCAATLRSLPESYESLVRAFRMSVTPFNLCDLVSKLIVEEVRKKESCRTENGTVLHVSKHHEKHLFGKKSGS